MNTTKPREFWIDDLNGYVYRNGIDACKNEIHVIEHSAYQAALEEIEKLKLELDATEKVYRMNRVYVKKTKEEIEKLKDDYKSAMLCCEKVSEQHKEIEFLKEQVKQGTIDYLELEAKVAKLERCLFVGTRALQRLSNDEDYIRDYRFGHVAPVALTQIKALGGENES